MQSGAGPEVRSLPTSPMVARGAEFISVGEKGVGVVEKVCVYSGVPGLVRARPGFRAVIQRADWVLLSRTFPSQPFGGC